MPQQLQRAMAAEAEAAREARAKVIAAEGEHKSSRALAHAAEIISQTPAALQVGSNQKPSITLQFQSPSPPCFVLNTNVHGLVFLPK